MGFGLGWSRLGLGWSRRRFLAVSGAAAAQAAAGLKGLGQAAGSAGDAAAAVRANSAEAARAMPATGVITGGIQPLMESMTRRPLRYKPVGGEFMIRNGKEFFNRPIYGVSSPTQAGDFRVDAGDLPEFSLYLPGHGGNLKLGILGAGAAGSKWVAEADEVVARYRPGRMIYEIRDGLLGKGMLRAEVLTTGEGAGFMVKVEGQDVPAGARLAFAFAGVSGRKGQRNGDIGCEKQPVSEFFQVRPEECDGNSYTSTMVVDDAGGTVRPARVLVSKAAHLLLTFPAGSRLVVKEFDAWLAPPDGADLHVSEAPLIQRPILTGSVEIGRGSSFITINRLSDEVDAGMHSSGGDPKMKFDARSAQVEAIAGMLKIDTPDEYVNAAAGNFGIAAETIWDQKNECVLHGGVAWRTMLAGWRGPYNLDALGNHDRAVQEFRHWLRLQNVSPVTTADPAIGPWDANMHHARKEGMLHSNGDLSNNHYDMNMVFVDVLLRHLMWTGDLEFAREVWPALQRHLAWEHRLLRRTYRGTGGKELPLYEAYAAIWASDNLQYNGGGAAHSSAYNVFAFRMAAKIAPLLDWDGTAYQAEAELIHSGMQELLWVKEQGAYGESKDLLGPQTVYSNPALWTVYHTIDSEVPTARQAWQMVAERLAILKHVPVHGEGVPEGGWYMLSCSNWLPYMWSLNLLLLAENMHMALAMWQTGMRDGAYRVFKGNLLDSMYMGLCPGDFHLTSALDVHRQEAQRDFGDPLGISSRALVEGLFGVQPDLITGEVRVRPGFPSEWDRASLKHKDFDFAWKRDGLRETYEFDSRLAKAVPVAMRVPARTTSLPVVNWNGKRVECAFDAAAVGAPILMITVPAARENMVSVEWHGRAPMVARVQRSYRVGEALELPAGTALAQVDDPQGSLHDGRTGATGFHTVFANMRESECAWSMPISFEVKAEAPMFVAVPHLAAGVRGEQVDLSSVLKHNVTEIFTRVYAEPRSEYCSLAFPDNLLGGWANPEGRASIDDAGLRAAGGLLKTGVGVDFATPGGSSPNCLFLSYWRQDESAVKIALSGRARGIYLLMTGSTLPQCSRMQHGTVSVTYTDGTSAKLALRNPETWWPIEQDYLLDDYLFVNDAPLPPRVDLRSGQTRILDRASFHGKGRTVPGGAATILHLPLDAAKPLASLQVGVELYGIVVGLMAVTVARA
jgi:hypothetical protein